MTPRKLVDQLLEDEPATPAVVTVSISYRGVEQERFDVKMETRADANYEGWECVKGLKEVVGKYLSHWHSFETTAHEPEAEPPVG